MERESGPLEFLHDIFPVYDLGGVKGVAAGGNQNLSEGIRGQLTMKGYAKVEEFRPTHDFLQGAKVRRRIRSEKSTCLRKSRALLWAKEFFQRKRNQIPFFLSLFLLG